ncbi:MAG: hypothetical protein QW701_02525 [Candidatus Nezhaarchaeales archaeon]
MASNTQELFLVLRPSKFGYSNSMAALILYSTVISYDIKYVLADLPQGFEAILKRYEEAREALSAAVRYGLLFYSESIMRACEPMISCLSKLIKRGVKVVCYLNLADLERERELAVEVSRLVLRASVKKLDDYEIREWLRILSEYSTECKKTADSLLEILSVTDASRMAVLTGLEGFQLVEILKKRGLEVKVRAAGLPYVRSPLEVMVLKYERGELSVDELKCLVNDYVDYIKNYVVRYETLEEAHIAWSCKKAPWLKSLFQHEIVGNNICS